MLAHLLVLTASDSDLRRAATTCPRASFKGESTLADANVVLNEHLRAMHHLNTQDCETFTAEQLQTISNKLYGVADPALLKVYDERQDNRRQVYGSAEEMERDFARLNHLIDGRAALHDVLRDGLCHRVVMWFVHHLPVAKQIEIGLTGLTLPLLPLADHTKASHPQRLIAEQDVAATAVHEAYEKSTSCQQCHVGGIPTLFVPEVKPTTPRQLARRCYTNYKDLFNVTCGPCDGVAGKYWGDNDDKDFTADPCVVIGTPSQIPLNERVLAAFPPQFSVDILAGSDRWGRTTNPAGHVKTPFPKWLDSMYGAKITGKWFASIQKDSDLWLLRHDTHYGQIHFNGTAIPEFLSFDVSEIHSQTRAQQAANITGPMVSLIKGLPSVIPGGCTCVADPVGVPDTIHARTDGVIPEDSEMQYLGRINLTLAEVDGSTVLVDHWANWFFHIFMDVDPNVPHYGRAPRRLASAYAGEATYDNWVFADPAIADPTVWNRGIPTHPMKVGPDHGKFCLNPTKVPMCGNISQATFPPNPAFQSVSTPHHDEAKEGAAAPDGHADRLPWHLVHRVMLPSIPAEHAHHLSAAAIEARGSTNPAFPSVAI